MNRIGLRATGLLRSNRLTLAAKYSTTETVTPASQATKIEAEQVKVGESEDSKAKKFRKDLYSNFHKTRSTSGAETPMTFAKMFRQSKFVGLGNQRRVKLYGKIVETTNSHLYIDYGGKFYAICERPEERGE